MSDLTEVKGIRLWNGVIVDLNALSGFTSPSIVKTNRYGQFGDSVHNVYNLEFVIHTHPSNITVREILKPGITVRIDPSKGHKYVKVTAEDYSAAADASVDFSTVNTGWELVDGYYTVNPENESENMVYFQEFLSKFNSLVKLWNNNKDIECLQLDSFKQDHKIDYDKFSNDPNSTLD